MHVHHFTWACQAICGDSAGYGAVLEFLDLKGLQGGFELGRLWVDHVVGGVARGAEVGGDRGRTRLVGFRPEFFIVFSIFFAESVN